MERHAFEIMIDCTSGKFATKCREDIAEGLLDISCAVLNLMHSLQVRVALHTIFKQDNCSTKT